MKNSWMMRLIGYILASDRLGKDMVGWNTMVEYNIDVCDGSINEATEFLQNMGYGNAKIGMTVLKTKLNYKTASALLITATTKTNLTKVKKTKEEFLDYIADESGIDWK